MSSELLDADSVLDRINVSKFRYVELISNRISNVLLNSICFTNDRYLILMIVSDLIKNKNIFHF